MSPLYFILYMSYLKFKKLFCYIWLYVFYITCIIVTARGLHIWLSTSTAGKGREKGYINKHRKHIPLNTDIKAKKFEKTNKI